MDLSTIGKNARAERCLMNIRLTNGIKRIGATEQCSNEAISPGGWCAAHLAQAHREFEEIVAAHRAGLTDASVRAQ